MPLVRINAPAFYKDADFLRWLNSPGVATWHHAGAVVDEYADVFFTYSDGDGSDAPTGSDQRPAIPAHIWEQVVALVAPQVDGGECLIWLSNLSE